MPLIQRVIVKVQTAWNLKQTFCTPAGQSSVLQRLWFMQAPVQKLPPLVGKGLLHCLRTCRNNSIRFPWSESFSCRWFVYLLLACHPPPQVAVQVPNDPQLDQPPSAAQATDRKASESNKVPLVMFWADMAECSIPQFRQLCLPYLCLYSLFVSNSAQDACLWDHNFPCTKIASMLHMLHFRKNMYPNVMYSRTFRNF